MRMHPGRSSRAYLFARFFGGGNSGTKFCHPSSMISFRLGLLLRACTLGNSDNGRPNSVGSSGATLSLRSDIVAPSLFGD